MSCQHWCSCSGGRKWSRTESIGNGTKLEQINDLLGEPVKFLSASDSDIVKIHPHELLLASLVAVLTQERRKLQALADAVKHSFSFCFCCGSKMKALT